MAKLSELRKMAKDMGISAAVIRRATTASELQSVISDHESHGSKPRKKSGRPVAKKKGGAPVKKAGRKTTTSRKGSGRKASTPAKTSRKSGKAKRSSNSSGSGYVPKGGRNTLGKVNFSKTDGWNPREGSAPDRIVKALKRFKGDREKVFNFLKKDIGDFVKAKKANGEKHTKQSREDMLRYRISRTAWDFAMRTGQHEAADNRVEYGTGGTGDGVFKRSKKRGAVSRSKPAVRKPAKKAGRKPAKAQRGAQRGRKPAKRGRPKAGSRR